MAENSKIEWTDHTFNPWTGCTKVSPACDHCYAEGWAKRYGLVEWGPHAPRRRTSASNWRKALKWDREAAEAGRPARVFCASLADVFDNHKSIEQWWRDDLYQLIHETPNLDWLLLTKRPQNIKRFLPPMWNRHGCPPNVWLGTTVENQEEAERRIPHLLNTPKAIRFLSVEPLLGPLDLTACPNDDALLGYAPDEDGDRHKIDWVICGGESGHGARQMHPEWARSLRDQCQDADVPFFFKQWGGLRPKDGGRMLDDVEWSDFPR